MSDTKQTLGQIAKAAFIDRLGQSSPILQGDSDAAWEAAANAVAEECASIADSYAEYEISHAGECDLDCGAAEIAIELRALKSEGHES